MSSSSKPILYYVPGSPPSRAVILVIKELNLDVELKHVNLATGENRTPEYLAMNPQHTVPTLADNGRFLWDSHAIATYLIGQQADDHPLYPKDLYTRARIDQRLHFDNGSLFAVTKGLVADVFFKGVYDISDSYRAAFRDGYGFLEKFLAVDEYLVGNRMTVADLSVITSVTQMAGLVPIEADKYPKLSGWIERMSKLPYFKEWNTELLREFFAFFNGVREANRAKATA